MSKKKYSATELMELENKYGAHNYHPLPVVLNRGEGVFVWDVNGKRYYDFLSAYSAVNQGHCHPRIVNALTTQAQQLSLTSRAFYNDKLGLYEQFITSFFGYDKVLPMNSGAEAVETALKLCRKWGYQKKKIEKNSAQIVVCEGNFHGRTTTIISFSDDENAFQDYAPYTPGFVKIPYDDIDALKKVLEENKNIVGFLVEPIQGEAGAVVPKEGYLKSAKELCEKHNVLFMADEIQSGLGRAGKLLACDYEAVKPDVLILGKALSGGVYPISAVLAQNEIMEVFRPGQHGSTFGGNPIAAKVAIEALSVLNDENLIQNSYEMGEYFRNEMEKFCKTSSVAIKIRGKGLMNALVINNLKNRDLAWDICVEMAKNGLLAKPTHTNIIRFSPPLTIKKEELSECIEIIKTSIKNFE